MDTFEDLKITCSDQYILSGRFYAAQNDIEKTPVLICPATGVTKWFYHPFAQWLSEQGYAVLVFDFRGIGDSLHGNLKDSQATIQDWGQLDIPAAIDKLIDKTGAESITLLGHSAGGQLLGITPNYKKVKNLVAVSGSTGHVKGLVGKTKILGPIMFNVIFPISTIVKGYGTTKFIGMGEDLPKGVAKQWAQFCSKPGYVINAIGKTIFDDYHQDINVPFTAIWSSDDEIASEVNVKDLLRLYPNAQTQMIELVPQQHGHKSIGHMSMFKKSHQNLWPLIEVQLDI